jgi:hypothetical protein
MTSTLWRTNSVSGAQLGLWLPVRSRLERLPTIGFLGADPAWCLPASFLQRRAFRFETYSQIIAARINDPHEQTAPIAKVVSYGLRDNSEITRLIMSSPRPAIDAMQFVQI